MFRNLVAATVLTLAGLSAASAAELPEGVRNALFAALADEQHAEAVYAGVIAKFGDVRPFSNIIQSERTHQSELVAMMKKYGVAVPANPYATGSKPKPEVPATLAAACELGVAAEIANRDLYDKTLLPAAAGYADVQAVFKALRDASQNNHLPAFQRCGGGQGGGGQGPGAGKRS